MVNKGRENWLKNRSPEHDGSEFGHRGGAFGYLGKPVDAWTEEELIDLGKRLCDYVKKNKHVVYIKDFFSEEGMNHDHTKYLKNKYPVFDGYYQHAKQILEGRFVNYPFYKKADGNHARFVMARHFDDFKGADLSEMPDNVLDKHEQMIREIKAARAAKKAEESYPDV